MSVDPEDDFEAGLREEAPLLAAVILLVAGVVAGGWRRVRGRGGELPVHLMANEDIDRLDEPTGRA